MRYLLDSDWAIEYLRGSDRFVNRISLSRPLGIGISIVSVAELYEGVAAAGNLAHRELGERELLSLLGGLQLLPVDLETTRLFGVERRRLRTEGRMIGDFDLLIAATALRHDLTLLTNNRRHFERIPNLVIESA